MSRPSSVSKPSTDNGPRSGVSNCRSSPFSSSVRTSLIPQVWCDWAFPAIGTGFNAPDSTKRREERAQQGGGLGFPHTADDFRAVMAGRRVEHPRAMLHPATFWVVGAEDQPADAEQADGVRAHRAQFQRDNQVATIQARVA